jgi:hypothetical protein
MTRFMNKSRFDKPEVVDTAAPPYIGSRLGSSAARISNVRWSLTDPRSGRRCSHQRRMGDPVSPLGTCEGVAPRAGGVCPAASQPQPLKKKLAFHRHKTIGSDSPGCASITTGVGAAPANAAERHTARDGLNFTSQAPSLGHGSQSQPSPLDAGSHSIAQAAGPYGVQLGRYEDHRGCAQPIYNRRRRRLRAPRRGRGEVGRDARLQSLGLLRKQTGHDRPCIAITPGTAAPTV